MDRITGPFNQLKQALEYQKSLKALGYKTVVNAHADGYFVRWGKI